MLILAFFALPVTGGWILLEMNHNMSRQVCIASVLLALYNKQPAHYLFTPVRPEMRSRICAREGLINAERDETLQDLEHLRQHLTATL